MDPGQYRTLIFVGVLEDSARSKFSLLKGLRSKI